MNALLCANLHFYCCKCYMHKKDNALFILFVIVLLIHVFAVFLVVRVVLVLLNQKSSGIKKAQ